MREVLKSIIVLSDHVEAELKVEPKKPINGDTPTLISREGKEILASYDEIVSKGRVVTHISFDARRNQTDTISGEIFSDGSIEFTLTSKHGQESFSQTYPRCGYEKDIRKALETLKKPVFFEEWFKDFVKTAAQNGFVGGIAVRGASCNLKDCAGISVTGAIAEPGMIAHLSRPCRNDRDFKDMLVASASPSTRMARVEYISMQKDPERPPLGRARSRICEREIGCLTSAMFPDGFTDYSSESLRGVENLTNLAGYYR